MPSLAQLKQLLSQRGLAVSGTKAQLEERLQLTQDWTLHETVYILDLYSEAIPSRSLIASYDIDGTLIEPNDPSQTFSEGLTDWHFREGMLLEVQQRHAEGYTILLFTNQARKANRHLTLGRLQRVAEGLGECVVFAATGRDQYRKPEIGMWDLAVEMLRLDPDLEHSFFMGDATGAPGSFSDSDLRFAENAGLRFRPV